MATSVENLTAAIASLDGIIATVTAAGPKPTYSIDGKSVDWAGYMAMLLGQREKLVEALLQAEGPYETRTRGIT